VKLYWTMNSIPELDGLDRKEKRKLFRQMYREGRKRTGMVPYLYFIIAAVLIGVASVFRVTAHFEIGPFDNTYARLPDRFFTIPRRFRRQCRWRRPA
jgi:uncharacterized membrane protein YczE